MASILPILQSSKLHHVGIVVADLDQAIAGYQQLGFGEADRFDLPEQGIRAAFIGLTSGAIELIQPTDPDGSIGRFMSRRGEGFHHVAYQVANIAQSLVDLEARNVELIDSTWRVGGHGLWIAFIHPRACNGVLTELVQIPPS